MFFWCSVFAIISALFFENNHSPLGIAFAIISGLFACGLLINYLEGAYSQRDTY